MDLVTVQPDLTCHIPGLVQSGRRQLLTLHMGIVKAAEAWTLDTLWLRASGATPFSLCLPAEADSYGDGVHSQAWRP